MLILMNRLFHGWVVVAAFFVISTCMFGVLTSFGVFFKHISDEFSLNRTETSLIFSAQNLIASVFSFVGGWAVDKYGPRAVAIIIGISGGLSLLLTSQASAFWQLFITYSLLFSVIGAVYTLLVSTVSRWFDKNRGLALGIAGSGIGMGMIAIAPFATYLIASHGWRTAYIVLGLIVWAFIISISGLFISNPSKAGDNSQAHKDDAGISEGISLREAVRTRSFWLFGPAWLLNAFCYFLVLIHVVPHATDIGISAIRAALVLSIIGASFIAGRIIMGKIADNIGCKITAIVCALLVVLVMIFLIRSKALIMLYLFGLVFGFANGGLDTAVAAMVSGTFGTRNIGAIMGLLQVNWGIGVVIGPAIGGLVYDISGGYAAAFIYGAMAMLIVAVLIAFPKRETAGKLLPTEPGAPTGG